MKKGLILLADGFEETEAITTHDILSRTHEIDCVLASITNSLKVKTSMGLVVEANCSVSGIEENDFDFIVLPGGKTGVDNLKACSKVKGLVLSFYKKNKGVYAICAAPSILEELGLLKGKTFTCFPGFEGKTGKYQKNAGAVVDGNIITGHSMAFTIPFAEEIVKRECGEEAIKRIRPGTRGGIA